MSIEIGESLSQIHPLLAENLPLRSKAAEPQNILNGRQQPAKSQSLMQSDFAEGCS